MIRSITQWFRTPTPAELAQRQLEDHQRCLVMARQSHQATTSTVRYHESSIAELRRTLAELEGH